jgi:hypothetical protein
MHSSEFCKDFLQILKLSYSILPEKTKINYTKVSITNKPNIQSGFSRIGNCKNDICIFYKKEDTLKIYLKDYEKYRKCFKLKK